MRDEVLARPTTLVGVAPAGEGESSLDRSTVGRLGGTLRVLGHDREQVAEELALLRIQVPRELVVGQVESGILFPGSDAGVSRPILRVVRGPLGGPRRVLGVRVYAAAGSGLELGSLRSLRNRTHSS